jgi:hypothetical protein
MKKNTIVIHPLLFGLYPVLFFYSHNIGQVMFGEVLKPSGIIIISVFVWWSFLRIILKSWAKSAIIISLFLILFFSYGHFRIFFSGTVGPVWQPLLWTELFLCGCYFSLKWKRSYRELTLILNVVSCILIALPTINIILQQSAMKDLAGVVQKTRPLFSYSELQKKTNDYPDLYFIVLDAYARADILEEMYGFDNSDFIDFLRKQGFFIADRSTSNYGQTWLTFASTFNMGYLTEFAKQIGEENPDRRPLDELVKNSYVLSYLGELGYTIVSFESRFFKTGWLETRAMSAGIELKTGRSINTFQNALRNMTPIPEIFIWKKRGNAFERHRKNILYTLKNLGGIAKFGRKPKFVVAHIDAPHPPFVFGPNGEPLAIESYCNFHDGNWLIRKGRLTCDEYRKLYVDQLSFINGLVKIAVDEILANSDKPPVIILCADHGARSEMVWEDPAKTNVKEVFAILNAYYMPEGKDKYLYPEITPVNTFRVVFNSYFGTEFDMLPDKNYFTKPYRPYKYYEVTERVQEAK